MIDAPANIDAIFEELRPGNEFPELITVCNQLVYNILLNSCDEEAPNIVLRYQHSDDEAQLLKMDRRRALFALMQTYSPVSTNISNTREAQARVLSFQAVQGHHPEADRPAPHQTRDP